MYLPRVMWCFSDSILYDQSELLYLSIERIDFNIGKHG